VAAEVLDTLNKWLLNHIKREDHDYMDLVKAALSPVQLSGILADCNAGRSVPGS
jgi:hemerythrin